MPRPRLRAEPTTPGPWPSTSAGETISTHRTWISAAQMLAERGDCRPAYDRPDAVAALAGCTPVTKESGKHRSVHFRWACTKRFRAAVTTFADSRGHHLRRQQPPRQPPGRPRLRQRDRRRQGPPARHPHPGPRLDPHHLPLLARRRPLRPRPAWRRRGPRSGLRRVPDLAGDVGHVVNGVDSRGL
jgi:hypothetical protein